MKRLLPFIIIIVVLGAALGAGWYLKRKADVSATPSSPASLNNPVNSSSVRTSSEPGAEPPHMHGSPDAPVKLEEFGDFECPPCALLHPILQTMEKQFSGRISITF